MIQILPLLGDIGLGTLSVAFVSHWYGVHDLHAFLLIPLAVFAGMKYFFIEG